MASENTTLYKPSDKRIAEMSLDEYAERKEYIRAIMAGQDGDGFEYFRKVAKQFCSKASIKLESFTPESNQSVPANLS